MDQHRNKMPQQQHFLINHGYHPDPSPIPIDKWIQQMQQHATAWLLMMLGPLLLSHLSLDSSESDLTDNNVSDDSNKSDWTDDDLFDDSNAPNLADTNVTDNLTSRTGKTVRSPMA